MDVWLGMRDSLRWTQERREVPGIAAVAIPFESRSTSIMKKAEPKLDIFHGWG